MDPLLVTLTRNLILAQKKATDAGIPLGPHDLEAYAREESKGKYGIDDVRALITKLDAGVTPRNVGRSLVQGATFDWGDELLGMLPEAVGGGPDAENEMRLRQDLFREQHPYVDMGAGVVGGLASSLLLPGGAAAGVGKTALRGAMIGAGAGALAGAGRGEGDLGDRAGGAATGFAGGAVLGAALPFLAGGVKSLAPKQAAQRVVEDAIEQSGGADKLKGVVMDFGIADRGDKARVFDLSDPLRLVGDRAVNNSDEALAKIAPSVIERQRNAAGRILDDARRTLPGGRPNFAVRADALKAVARDIGKNGYNPLREANPTIALEPETVEVLGQPVVRDALRKAKVTAMIGPDAPKTGPLPVGFAQLHETKRALDGAISVAFKSGDGYRAEKLVAARDLLLKEMSKAPGADAVSASYRAAKDAERALVAGRKAWNTEDVDEIANQMSHMTGDALEQFRYGIAAKMYAKLANAKTNRNVAKEIMDASEAMTQKLKIVFGNEQNFQRFMFRVEREAQLAKAAGMFGNSATHRRAMAAGFDPIERVAGMMSEGAPSPKGIIGSVVGKVGKARQRSIANYLGDYVSQGGSPDALDSFLDTFSNPEPLLGRLMGTAVPAASGGLMSKFF